MLTIGEVHTGLLQHSTALSQTHCGQLLSLREGESVLWSQRPTAYAVSPDLPTGVDCQLPSVKGRRVTGIGTVVSRAIVTGGRVLQASSATRIGPSVDNQRQPWSHYLVQPGRIETLGKANWADIAEGFVHGNSPDSLNVGAITARVLDLVQVSGHLDRQPPFRSQRTRLRWTAIVDESRAKTGSAVFTVQSDTLRTVELVVGPEDAAAASGLCEDLALHDWLLTTLSVLLEATISSPRPAVEKAARLRPVVEHLLHLWVPGARVAFGLLPVWTDIERSPGFSRQWNASVNWIRDQLAAGTMALLQTVAAG